MITGIHAIVYSKKADAVRRFVGDVLGFGSIDIGGGWLLFALPPAELAVHPDAEGGRHELFLMCDDLDGTIAELTGKGAEFTGDVTEQDWGRETSIRLPDGTELQLYEAKHVSPNR